jgi:hypothetical protein
MLINHQPGRFDVATQRATRLELAAFSYENIAHHRPRTFTDFVLISPRMSACSPSVSVPVESIVPSTSPSMRSSFRNLTKPLIEAPRERRAPDCVGMNVRLDGPGTIGGLADSFAWAAGSVFRVNMCIP